jgi:hypothetical protein
MQVLTDGASIIGMRLAAISDSYRPDQNYSPVVTGMAQSGDVLCICKRPSRKNYRITWKIDGKPANLEAVSEHLRQRFLRPFQATA